jgi:hydroxymethylbilane synthase
MHQATWLAVSAERAVSRVMGGSCSMPLAAHAVFAGEHLHIQAAWGDPEGMLPLVQTQATATVLDTAAAVRLGERVAASLQDSVKKASGLAP